MQESPCREFPVVLPSMHAFDSAGRLFKLDMSSYGLVCPFPVDDFAAFEDLESLDLSDNFDLSVRCLPGAAATQLQGRPVCFV